MAAQVMANMSTPPVLAAAVAATLGAALLLVAVRRRRLLLAGDRAWRAAHGVAADGIIPGARPIVLEGGVRAVLLLHGFGDTPQSLARQAHALHARGFTVRAPLLPGHGRTLEAFRETDAEAWMAAAREAYAALVATHHDTAIVGLSMGGALATRLAADGPSPSSLVLVVPYLHLSAKARWLTTCWPIWSLWRAWVPGDPSASIREPAAREASLGYGIATPRLLRELRRVVEAAIDVAPRIVTPTLVINSTGDYRIAPEAARASFARLGSAEKVLVWVERSGHVVTVDFDADEVTARLIDWLDRHPAISAPNP